MTNQTIHIHSAAAVNIGDYGSAQITAAILALSQQIESCEAPAEEKAEAKSRLSSLLAHPLVTALVGNVV